MSESWAIREDGISRSTREQMVQTNRAFPFMLNG